VSPPHLACARFANACLRAETNRKCPRWHEFNSPNAAPPLTPTVGGGGAAPASASAPAMEGASPPAAGAVGMLRASASYASSPLAMSPPVSAMNEDDGSGTAGAPKLKLTLGKR
jgi:hypothetical protein